MVPSPEVAAEKFPGLRPYYLLLSVLLLLASYVILRDAGVREFHLNTDEAQHAVTGLFFSDFLRDMPFSQPVRYAYRYYAQYQSLGVIHWPPFFHVSEGVMFLLLGPSAWSARLTVCLFAVVGWWYWARLVALVDGPRVAVASVFLLAMLPYLLLFEKAVMLEIPSLALCLAASYYWYRYLQTESARHLIEFAVVSSLALLTKQQSLYLAVFCFITLLAQRRLKGIFTRSGILAFCIPLFSIVPFYVYSYAVHGQTIRALVSQSLEGQGNGLIFYWRYLPLQLGWPLLVLSFVGIVTLRWWAKWEAARLMLLWILSCYLMALAFATKEPRYVIYWLPPLVYFAVGPLLASYKNQSLQMAGRAVAVALLAFQMYQGWIFKQPYVAGFQDAAQKISTISEGGILLYDAGLPGNFSFYLRSVDPERRFIVMRKALYVTNTLPLYGSKQLVNEPDQIRELLRRYGIRYIVVDRGRRMNFAVQTKLRELLATPQFRKVEEFPLRSNISEWKDVALELFENLEVQPRTETMLRIQMLTLSNNIEIPIDEILNKPAAPR